MPKNQARLFRSYATLITLSAALAACGGSSGTDSSATPANGTTPGSTVTPVSGTSPTTDTPVATTPDSSATPVATTPDAGTTPVSTTPVAVSPVNDAVVAVTTPRVMEKLGRGVVALRVSSKNVFVSWRLLGLDPSGIGFNLYRSAAGATAVKLNATTLTAGTNYMDTTSNADVDNSYTVRPVINEVEQAASGPFNLTGHHAGEPVVRIPLSALPGSSYKTTFVWVGDLDGDGEYDFIVDRISDVIDGVPNGNQYLEAYKRDGTRLWQIDLGPNSLDLDHISPGATTLSRGMYDGVTVYDLNGDGKAEVILKIADGVKFGDGSTFSEANPKQQYLAVLDGLTGKPLATQAFPSNFSTPELYGTQLGIGYPDGITPSVYFWGRTRLPNKEFYDVFASYSWKGGASMTTDWVYKPPADLYYRASHQMRIIDLDGDGKDELASGDFVINSNGTLKYVLPGVAHGDRFYLAKMDPSSPDIQGYGIQQDNVTGLLEYYYNATTGKIIWSHSTTPGTLVDVGRGLAADIDPRFAGHEVYSFSGIFNGPTGTLTQPSATTYPYPIQQVWWDGDLLTDQLGDNVIDKWNAATGKSSRLESLYDYNSTWAEHNPMFMGDILGDWRTEIVTMNKTYTELMIFSSDIPTTTRAYTMAHNPAYRNHMTIKGYMQSPTLDYYFGDGMGTPPVPNIRYAGSGTLQAESALLAGGTSVASDRSGYHGIGFIDFPGTGGSAQFTIDGGDGGAKTIAIRYANGDGAARSGTLTVNGKAQAISFNATGGWTNWSTMNVSLTLAKGMANKIVFASTGNDLGNIDEITVQ